MPTSTRAAARRPRRPSARTATRPRSPRPAGATFTPIADDLDLLPQAAPAERWAYQPPQLEPEPEPAPIQRATIRPTPEQLWRAGALVLALIFAGLAAWSLSQPGTYAAAPAPAPTAVPTVPAVGAAGEPAAAPSSLAFPAPAPVTGWWAPGGEAVALPAPLTIETLEARCSSWPDLVQVRVDDGAGGLFVWLTLADAGVDRTTVDGLYLDHCAEGV